MSSVDQLVSSLVGRTIPISFESVRNDTSKASLPHFIRRFWPCVEPTRPLIWGWHLDEICKVLMLAREGKVKRIIFNMPPGTMKSMLVSVFMNAWWWADDASIKFLTASYSSDNTIRDNLRLKDIINSEDYISSFWKPKNVSLSSSQDAKERFNTTLKGYRIASSVKGTFTGEHPDVMVLDDLLKAQDADSEAKIDECNNWLNSTVSTRLALDPIIILVMQRLHEKDATAHLLAKGGWTHVVFPMRYEATRVDEYDPRTIPDPRDRRTSPGELLWPAVWDEAKVSEEETLLGPLAGGQLQQYPVPLGGALFKREYFPVVDAAPTHAQRCRGWDIAETDNGGDETWGVRLALDDDLLYVDDAVWDQVTLTDRLIKQVAEVDGKGVRIREGAGSGKAVTKARSVLLRGWDYGVSPETESKTARANPFLAQCRAGNVRMVRGPWNEAYLNRVCAFPFGRYDDPVDATSNAANELMGVVGKKKGRLTWGRRG